MCPNAEVGLTLSDDQELQFLNRTYAQQDHPTDVLSFSQQEGAQTVVATDRDETGSARMPVVLGDIVISVERAAAQAQMQGHSLLHELVHLSVHGLCHLLGMDHADPQEEARMFSYEALVREQAHARGRVHTVSGPHQAKTTNSVFRD